MTLEIGPLDPLTDPWPTLSDHVVIVFGGVTRGGDKRARRHIRTALAEQRDVVWFDGWEGVDHSGLRPKRHVLDAESERSVVVIGYRASERSMWVNRLPSAQRFVLSRLKRSPVGRAPGAGAVLGAVDWVWRHGPGKLLGLIAKAGRGRMAWGMMEPSIRAVAERVPSPECLVYADDYSLPVAWNAASSVWTKAPAAGSLQLSKTVDEQQQGRR